MHISIAAEKIFNLFGLSVTNSLFTSWIASILIITLAILYHRPALKRLHTAWIVLIEAFFNLFNSVIEDREATKRYFPLLATIFIFVLFNNWLGLLPGVGSVGVNQYYHGEVVLIPILRPGSADLNMTIALAITAVVAVQYFAIRAIGFKMQLSKYFTFSNPINFFVGILEFIAEFARMISFSFRLFGNIFAGEVLLMIILVLAPYFIPIPFYGLELFVGLIQALVFTMLTLVFIKTATALHGEEHAH